MNWGKKYSDYKLFILVKNKKIVKNVGEKLIIINSIFFFLLLIIMESGRIFLEQFLKSFYTRRDLNLFSIYYI